MKMFVAFAALLAVASAATFTPLTQKDLKKPEYGVAVVKEQLHDNIGVGGYKYSYELSDGQTRNEVADVATFRDSKTGEESAVVRVQGSFSFVDPQDGKVYSVSYIADENGFQPQGAHLPTLH